MNSLPTKPNVGHDNSAMVIFTNLMLMIHQKQHTADSANRFLDSLGLPQTYRFWGVGSKVDPKNGRVNVVYFSWKNGQWVNSQGEVQEMIRNNIDAKPDKFK